VHGNEQDKIVT